MSVLQRFARFEPTDEQPGDAGMSIIELVVAMVVSLIVGVMALNFFVGTLNESAKTTTSTLVTAGARNVLDSVAQLIQVADSPLQEGASSNRFEQIGPDDLIFYANVANRGGATSTSAPTAPLKIWISLSGGQLVERRYTADAGSSAPFTYSSYPSTPSTSLVLLGCTTATANCFTPGTVSATTLFTAYYPSTGCASSFLTSAALCSVDPATTASISDAVAVGISFTITASDGTTKYYTTLAAVNGESS